MTSFQSWLSKNNGFINPFVKYSAVSSGFAIIAESFLPENTTVVTCPFHLAITPEVSRQALHEVLGDALTTWTERQLICSYIAFYLVKQDEPDETKETLRGFTVHKEYVATFPTSEKLMTPLHFTADELQGFRGTNMYGATLDRKRDWNAEWEQCHKAIHATDPNLAILFTWEHYLAASTYLSSRAFPSTLLSNIPTLQQNESSHPILLPGIDALNHARGQAVTWVVSTDTKQPSISLLLHAPVDAGSELFNNYGAKPNSEFILGYGFSLQNNPEDTIVLKIGGGGNSGKKWEIGRDGQLADGLYDEILASVAEDPESVNYEDHLAASEVLAEMVQGLLERLPADAPAGRKEVVRMWHDYIQGQRDILESLIEFASRKETLAVEDARSQGIEIQFE